MHNRKPKREYTANTHQLDPCELINSTLAAAQSGIGTCIDKVKVGYVMMQLQLQKVHGNQYADGKIELLGRTIDFVEGLNKGNYIFDVARSRFEPVVIVNRELADDERSMACTVRIDGIERCYTDITYALPEMHDLHQIDMRFLECRTMTDETVVDAAVAFIRG